MELYDKVTTLGTGAGGAVYLVRHKETKKWARFAKFVLRESIGLGITPKIITITICG